MLSISSTLIIYTTIVLTPFFILLNNFIFEPQNPLLKRADWGRYRRSKFEEGSEESLVGLPQILFYKSQLESVYSLSKNLSFSPLYHLLPLYRSAFTPFLWRTVFKFPTKPFLFNSYRVSTEFEFWNPINFPNSKLTFSRQCTICTSVSFDFLRPPFPHQAVLTVPSTCFRGCFCRPTVTWNTH